MGRISTSRSWLGGNVVAALGALFLAEGRVVEAAQGAGICRAPAPRGRRDGGPRLLPAADGQDVCPSRTSSNAPPRWLVSRTMPWPRSRMPEPCPRSRRRWSTRSRWRATVRRVAAWLLRPAMRSGPCSGSWSRACRCGRSAAPVHSPRTPSLAASARPVPQARSLPRGGDRAGERPRSPHGAAITRVRSPVPDVAGAAACHGLSMGPCTHRLTVESPRQRTMLGRRTRQPRCLYIGIRGHGTVRTAKDLSERCADGPRDVARLDSIDVRASMPSERRAPESPGSFSTLSQAVSGRSVCQSADMGLATPSRDARKPTPRPDASGRWAAETRGPRSFRWPYVPLSRSVGPRLIRPSISRALREKLMLEVTSVNAWATASGATPT